jgi:dihydrofolate reductase
MKTLLHMAVSIDGFIAKPDGDSDWVSAIDCALFEERYKAAGCVVVGRRTYDQFRDLYPMPGITNIVLTRDGNFHSDESNVFAAHSVEDAIVVAKEKGHEEILIAGGGHTNATFLEADLVDEMFLSVHPFVLGAGIKLFEESSGMHQFEYVGSRELEDGLIELHYKKKSAIE